MASSPDSKPDDGRKAVWGSDSLRLRHAGVASLVMQVETRLCKVHGQTEFALEHRSDGDYFRCRKCRSENVTRMRRNLRLELVEAAGGKCSRCGYDRCVGALHFHHANEDKVKAVSVLIRNGKRWDARREAKKCVLVCANCHAEIHQPVSPNGG